jgi:hypothetical protein
VASQSVSSGLLCLDGATVNGSVTVSNGAGLIMSNVIVRNSVLASRPGAVRICGTQVDGSVALSGASGFIQIGPGGGCFTNKISGALSLSGKAAGLRVGFNAVGNGVSVTNNVRTGGIDAVTKGPSATVLQGNTITGNLTCSGNSPVVTNAGGPNTVSGQRSGECVGV